MHKSFLLPAYCLFGVLLNIVFSRIFLYAGFPLYLDTVFTITVTLSCGLVWGTICGALTNIVSHTIFGNGWEAYLFMICNIATAIITWFFYRIFIHEFSDTKNQQQAALVQRSFQPKSNYLAKVMDRVIILILFSFILCLAMSILGGLIATFILYMNNALSGPTGGISGLLSATMFGQDVPLLFKEIVSRIPVNIVDRLISVFAGFGIALLLRRLKVSPHWQV